MTGGLLFSTSLTEHPRPEGKLLLLCARTRPGKTDIEQIKTLSRLPIDWEYLRASADKHRLTQLLYKNLSAHCPDVIPPEIKARLRHQFYTNAGSNLHLAHVLIGLLEKFSINSIPIIPFKGSILAHRTYGKLSLRQNYDLDLFIREQDIDQSRNLLFQVGYLPEKTFDRALSFVHAEEKVEIDLHWGFAPRYFHLSVDFDGLYARARAHNLMEHRVITFSPEDLLIILCLQVMKDCWERQQRLEHLSKICDITEHIRAEPRLEWATVFERAHQDGLLRILDCALILSHELLGAELPDNVWQKIRSDHAAQKKARWLCRHLFTPADTLSPLENSYSAIGLRFRQFRFYIGIRERNCDRLKHIQEIFKLL